MGELAAATEGATRPNGLKELELLRTITSGFASFGSAVRESGLSDVQKSRVLAGLAEASRSMMDATNAYLFELNAARRSEKPAQEVAAAVPVAALVSAPAATATTAAG
ncbi:hypothetical protein [Phreatobacter sp.]|uniref:hypothetical protein n=1 Tax=Phreatobacter sp. TaxID=1966341 RepID=UPI003F728FAA